MAERLQDGRYRSYMEFGSMDMRTYMDVLEYVDSIDRHVGIEKRVDGEGPKAKPLRIEGEDNVTHHPSGEATMHGVRIGIHDTYTRPEDVAYTIKVVKELVGIVFGEADLPEAERESVRD